MKMNISLYKYYFFVKWKYNWVTMLYNQSTLANFLRVMIILFDHTAITLRCLSIIIYRAWDIFQPSKLTSFPHYVVAPTAHTATDFDVQMNQGRNIFC